MHYEPNVQYNGRSDQHGRGAGSYEPNSVNGGAGYQRYAGNEQLQQGLSSAEHNQGAVAGGNNQQTGSQGTPLPSVSQPTTSQASTANEQQQVFQGMTVQQLLKAHFKIVKQELDRQSQEHTMFQWKMQKQLLDCQARGGLAWGPAASS